MRKRQEAEAEAEERVRQVHERELAAAKEHEEAAMSASRLLEEAAASAATEAEAAAEEARQREAAAKIREEATLAAAEQANNALRQGIRPIEMPTEQQYQDAKSGSSTTPRSSTSPSAAPLVAGNRPSSTPYAVCRKNTKTQQLSTL